MKQKTTVAYKTSQVVKNAAKKKLLSDWNKMMQAEQAKEVEGMLESIRQRAQALRETTRLAAVD